MMSYVAYTIARHERHLIDRILEDEPYLGDILRRPPEELDEHDRREAGERIEREHEYWEAYAS